MIDRRRPRVSLCMIVRNEAHNLAACLAPVHDLVDEMIVVDTGSTDETREIARECGAQVFDFPWTDDFSAARNESFRHATGDYILWLDADDRMDAENVARLETLLDSLNGARKAFIFRTVCDVPADAGVATIITHPRLFRANEQLRWQYRVHEQIMSSLELLSYEVVWADVSIQHLGYADRDMIHKKASRNLRLCRLDYAMAPNDPAVLFHLGKECARIGNFPESLVYLLKSLQAVTNRGTWVARLYGDIVVTLTLLGRAREAFAMASEGLVHFPNSQELLFRQAELLKTQGDDAGAEQTLRRLLQAPQQNRFGDTLPVTELRSQAYRAVGSAFLGRQDFEQAERFFQQWIAEAPGNPDAWCMLGYAYIRRQYAQKAEFVVRQLHKLPGGEPLACCIQSEVCKLHGDWSGAREHLERAVALAPLLLMSRAMLVDLLVARKAGVEECRQAVDEFLRLAPNNTLAQRLREQLSAVSQSSPLSSQVTDTSSYSVTI